LTFDGVFLETRDGEPKLVVPQEIEAKSKHGWEVRVLKGENPSLPESAIRG
jgi:hypothetical protein